MLNRVNLGIRALTFTVRRGYQFPSDVSETHHKPGLTAKRIIKCVSDRLRKIDPGRWNVSFVLRRESQLLSIPTGAMKAAWPMSRLAFTCTRLSRGSSGLKSGIDASLSPILRQHSTLLMKAMILFDWRNLNLTIWISVEKVGDWIFKSKLSILDDLH